MPESRYYTVTQEREVKICANSALDAAVLATEAFEDNGAVNTSEGRTTSPIRIRDLVIREDY